MVVGGSAFQILRSDRCAWLVICYFCAWLVMCYFYFYAASYYQPLRHFLIAGEDDEVIFQMMSGYMRWGRAYSQSLPIGIRTL